MNFKEYLTKLTDALNDISVIDSGKQPVQPQVAINIVTEKILEGKNRVLVIGNGGSASIASHIVVDLWKNGGIRALAFNDASLLTCVGNDYGFEHIFEKPIGMFADEGDIVFAISSSGSSENILNGVKAAIKKNCTVVTFSGFSPDNPLRTLGHINFYVSSESYGFVETAHLAICHCIADIIISKNRIG